VCARARAWEGREIEVKALVWKPEGMRPLGRPTYKWEDSIKIDPNIEIGDYGLDSSGLGGGLQMESFEHSNECWEFSISEQLLLG
jgi:hypothetical protein